MNGGDGFRSDSPSTMTLVMRGAIHVAFHTPYGKEPCDCPPEFLAPLEKKP